MEKFVQHKTENGRSFFTMDLEGQGGFPDFTNGYIEINENHSANYLDKFYRRFNLPGGATFMGVLFPGVIRENGYPLMIGYRIKNPIHVASYGGIEGFINERILPEYVDEFVQLTKGKDYKIVIGFDDNHITQIGKLAVIEETERIAKEMDYYSRLSQAN